MPQKPDGKGFTDQQRVAFTRPAAERIARAVRKVEAGPRTASALSFLRVGDVGIVDAFRMCTFTGAWDKGTLHLTTFYGVTTTPNTVTATNLFANVEAPSGGTAACGIAIYRGTWYLIAAEC